MGSIGLIGLGVMGASLAENIESRGYSVSVYNRTASISDEFLAEQAGRQFSKADSLEDLVSQLESPRQIILMIKAGKAVDSVVEQLVPYLSKGDVIIDGGNSFFPDTNRREESLKEKGIIFIGAGISGGEEGARIGPCIMPGCSEEGWKIVAPLFEKISAQADGPCVSHIGTGGSGHYVKMVHNGIEYGDMQLIAETYDVLQKVVGLGPNELAEVFHLWNTGRLSSYLVEITAKIFEKKDEGEGYLVNAILDKAGQKGTGRWTVVNATQLGVPIPTISAAVDARVLSSMKSERVQAAKTLGGVEKKAVEVDSSLFVRAVEEALYAAKVIAYAQGMSLLRVASKEWDWSLNLSEIARIWQGGCIIRANLLKDIKEAFEVDSALENLLLSPNFDIAEQVKSLRGVVQTAVECGVPVPALSSSLYYYESYRSSDLPQNLTQAQRDFFGAHTYERKDKEGMFHTEWE